jgi:hypothetical protein
VKPYCLGRANAVLWNTGTSADPEGCTYAAVFLSANGVSLARDFISKFEAGQKMTMGTRLGIKGSEKLRVTHRSSLVLKFGGQSPIHISKKMRMEGAIVATSSSPLNYDSDKKRKWKSEKSMRDEPLPSDNISKI